MEDTIVIATRNNDKFIVIKNLLTDFGLGTYRYCMLDDFPGYKEIDETGTIQNRSKQKVSHFIKFLQQQGNSLPDVIVGIDDGIRKQEEAEANPHSKEITQNILKGIYVKHKNIIFIVRSFTFFITKYSLYYHAITEIPFKYYKKMADFDENGYPLQKVLGYQNSNKTVCKESNKNIRKYNKEYSKNLQGVINKIRLN